MKKIVIAVDTYFPKKDGVVRFLENIVPRLAKHYFVTVLAPDFNTKSKFFNIKNVNEIQFPVDTEKNFANYHPVKKTAQAERIIRREIRNCDLVFSQDIAYLGGQAIKIGKECRKPVVAYIHQIVWEQLEGIFAERKIKRFFWSRVSKIAARGLYSKCSMLFVPSRITAEQLKAEGISKEKAIIHLGVDLEKFCPPKTKAAAKVNVKIDKDKLVIGYSGRISKEKDLLTLRDAFLEVKRKFPDTILLVVGGGTGGDAEQLKKTQDVIITGFVKDVTPYLKAMDVFVLPSITETTSLATMEAMSCAVPVITTPVGRLAEYVQNNVNGYLFPAGNSEILTRRLEILLGSAEKRAAMGANARKSISQFSWEFTAQQIVQVFENLTHQI